MILVCMIVLWKGTVFGWKNDSDILLSKYNNHDSIQATGEVYKTEKKPYYQNIYLKCQDIRYLIQDTSFLPVSLGNTLQVTGKLVFFEEARNPGNFNPKLYYDKQKIAAIIQADSIQITHSKVNQIRQILQEMRQRGIQQVYRFMEPKQAAMMVAILFGEKKDLDAQDKELYQKVGISHIFAISGVHISILSLLIYELLRRSTGSFKVAGIIGSLLLAAYIILTGTSTSALRAGIMFCIRILADITGRVYDLRTAVAVAAILIIMGQPQLLWDGGFLLSFGAIGGVIYWAKPCQELWKTIPIPMSSLGKKCGKIGQIVLQGIGVSFAIQLTLYPIILQYFYESSPYSFFLNIFIIPLMNPLLICAILGVLLSFVLPTVAGLFFQMCEYVLTGIDWISRVVIQLPQSRVVVGTPEWYFVFLYYGILFFVCYRLQVTFQFSNERKENQVHTYGNTHQRKIRGKCKRKQWLWLLLLHVLPLIFLIPKPLPSLQISMIDVGQGNCFFVRGPKGNTYLLDCGSTTVTEVAKYRVEPYLKSQGVAELDYVFVSHGDQDHINGIIEMFQRKELGIKIKRLVICKMQLQDPIIQELVMLANKVGTEVVSMKPGESIIEGSMTLTYLLPREEQIFTNGNENSMILDLTIQELQVLFTGDMEGQGEEELIEVFTKHNRQYTIYQVAHHGSKHSNTVELLQLIQPQFALISAGQDNSYGHPHDSVIERLEKQGGKVFRTDQDGCVTIIYNEKNNHLELEKTIGVK